MFETKPYEANKELKLNKHSVVLSFNQEDMYVVKETEWHLKGRMGDSRYLRKQGERVWVPTEQSVLDEYAKLEMQMNELAEEMYKLGADHEGGWYKPEGEWETTYLETEEEWKARCEALDAE